MSRGMLHYGGQKVWRRCIGRKDLHMGGERYPGNHNMSIRDFSLFVRYSRSITGLPISEVHLEQMNNENQEMFASNRFQ